VNGKPQDKLVAISGVAFMASGVAFLYGRTIKRVAAALGARFPKCTNGEEIEDGEMYEVRTGLIRKVE